MNDEDTFYIAPGKATGPAIWLDEEEHGADCTDRFNDCDEAGCSNGNVCRIDRDILHDCGSTEHYMP